MQALIDNTRNVTEVLNIQPYWLPRNDTGLAHTSGLDSAKLVFVDEMPESLTSATRNSFSKFKTHVEQSTHRYQNKVVSNCVNFLVASNFEYNEPEFDANRRCIKIYTSNCKKEQPVEVTHFKDNTTLIASLFMYFMICVQQRLQEFETFLAHPYTWCLDKNLSWTKPAHVDEFPESRRLSADDDFDAVYRYYCRLCLSMKKESALNYRTKRQTFEIKPIGSVGMAKVQAIMRWMVPAKRDIPLKQVRSFQAIPHTLFTNITSHTEEYERRLRETQRALDAFQVSGAT